MLSLLPVDYRYQDFGGYGTVRLIFPVPMDTSRTPAVSDFTVTTAPGGNALAPWSWTTDQILDAAATYFGPVFSLNSSFVGNRDGLRNAVGTRVRKWALQPHASPL